MNTQTRRLTNASENVIEIPRVHFITFHPEKAGDFLLTVRTETMWVDGTPVGIEDLTVDPDAEIEDGALVMVQWKRARPWLTVVYWTGRDHKGRYVPKGDPRECFYFSFGMRMARNEPRADSSFRIIGRVVGPYRRTFE